jgi:peptidoglycan/LPS O-acetylase OafA/YrhL
VSSSQNSAHRIASLDLLRGVAAFAVAISHYLVFASVATAIPETISVLAVEVFFILSGFVLAPQILFCVRRGNPRNITIFLMRRWMRTVPPYVCALLAISFILGPVALGDFARYLFYVQNLFAQHNSTDYFPVAWSLSVEEWFYLTFLPLVFLASTLIKQRSTRFCAIVAIAFIAIIGLLRSVFGDYSDWGFEVRRVVIFRIDSIAYGFLLYLVIAWLDRRVQNNAARVAGTAILLIVSAPVAFDVTLALGERPHRLAEELFPFYAAGFGMAAVALFHALGPLFARSPALARFCIFMGQISYSTYLFHLLVATILMPAVSTWGLGLQIAVYLAVIAVATAVFYRYFESPILSGRPHYSRDVELPTDRDLSAAPQGE